MGKDFSKNNPLDRLNANMQKNIIAAESLKNNNSLILEPTQPELEQAKIPEKQERKVGRPITKDIKNTCKNINVAVPITLLNKWEEIKIVHGSNLTAYITKLIEKDMDTNYKRYKKFIDSLNNI